MAGRQVYCAVVAALFVLVAAPQRCESARAARRPLTGEKVTSRGSVDWDRGSLYAVGLGAVPSREPNQAKAYLRARTYAKLDALRNLLMVVDHVRIDSHTTGADFEAVSDVIRAEVKGIVRGAQVVAERTVRMGNASMVEVTVATPLYGDTGIASVFVPEIQRRSTGVLPEPGRGAEPSRSSRAMPEVNVRIVRPEAVRPAPSRPEPPAPDTGSGYTSLIVDARGLGVERCMSPKIRRPDGSEVWGTVGADPDFVIEHGIVAYARSLTEARQNARAGDNPLVVRAIGRAGGRFNSDAVLSDADADLVLHANGDGGFLDRYRVVFVVDPSR